MDTAHGVLVIKEKKGFTLIEVLLSVSVLVVMLGFMAPLAERLLVQNNIDSARTTVASSLRRAYTFARASERGTAWGMHIEGGKITVFSGTSYQARTTDLDEMTEIADTIKITGVTDVVFANGSGAPNKTGTITFSTDQETRSLILNEKAAIIFK